MKTPICALPGQNRCRRSTSRCARLSGSKKRAQRIALLASVCGREPRYFRSSKDLLFEEASALIDRLYETDGAEESLSTAHLRPEVADAIRHAWHELISEEGS